jgi:hypothetical protein
MDQHSPQAAPFPAVDEVKLECEVRQEMSQKQTPEDEHDYVTIPLFHSQIEHPAKGSAPVHWLANWLKADFNSGYWKRNPPSKAACGRTF